MATIETQFNLIDRMSAPLQKINTVLGLVVSQMGEVDSASNLGFNNSAINATNDCLVAVNKNIENINNNAILIKSSAVNTNNVTTSISNLQNQVESVNNKNISISSNIKGVNEVNTSIGSVKNQVELVNNTPIAVTGKINSMSNITTNLNKVENSINSINKTPIDISSNINKNITSTNKFSTALMSVKNTISSMTNKSINLTTNTSSLIKAKSLLSDINNDLKSNNTQQVNWNNSISSGTSLYSKFAGVIASIGIGYGIKSLGTTFISSAADLEATQAKYETVFAGFTQQAQNIVDDFQKLTPATKSSTRSMVSGIQDLLVPMGFARSEATNMTGDIMTLTGALTNFNSATHTAEDVAGVFTSALTGEYDALKALGVQLNVTTVKEHAVAMGLATTTDAVTTQHQAIAMLELAYAQSGDALDAYNEESLDTISNMGILKASFIDTFAVIGQSMLPKVNELLIKIKNNMPTIERILFAIADGFIYALDVAVILFDRIMIGTQYIIDNWSIIAPIITNVAIAFGILITVFYTLQTIIKLVTIAQQIYNITLLGCPIIWIILCIIILIGVLYLVIDTINKVTGSTISATGIICGVLSIGVAFISNLFFGLWNFLVDGTVRSYNMFAMFGNFIGNFLNNPISAVIRLFANMVDTVLSMIQSIAGAIDMVIGTNLSKGLQSFRNNIQKFTDNLIGEETVYIEYLNGDDFKFDRLNYGESYNNGYNFVDNVQQTITSVFDTSSLESLGDYTNYLEFPVAPDYSSLSDLEYLDELNNSSFPEIPEEDLKYLRDIAEREVINRFTTAQVKVDLGGVTNNVNNNNDLDGFIDYLANEVNEAMKKTADGVYV